MLLSSTFWTSRGHSSCHPFPSPRIVPSFAGCSPSQCSSIYMWRLNVYIYIGNPRFVERHCCTVWEACLIHELFQLAACFCFRFDLEEPSTSRWKWPWSTSRRTSRRSPFPSRSSAPGTAEKRRTWSSRDSGGLFFFVATALVRLVSYHVTS